MYLFEKTVFEGDVSVLSSVVSTVVSEKTSSVILVRRTVVSGRVKVMSEGVVDSDGVVVSAMVVVSVTVVVTGEVVVVVMDSFIITQVFSSIVLLIAISAFCASNPSAPFISQTVYSPTGSPEM